MNDHDLLLCPEDTVERERLLRRNPEVLPFESALLQLALRLGIFVFFQKSQYMDYCNEVFDFVGPLSVPGAGFPRIDVLNGYIYWPSPILSEAPYQFLHEVSHLVAADQPPTAEKEGWRQAAAELLFVRFLAKDSPKKAIYLPERTAPAVSEIHPISEHGWDAWRCQTSGANSIEAPILKMARARAKWLCDDKRSPHKGLFTSRGVPKSQKYFVPHPLVRDMENRIKKWRLGK